MSTHNIHFYGEIIYSNIIDKYSSITKPGVLDLHANHEHIRQKCVKK